MASSELDDSKIPASATINYERWASYEIEPGVRSNCICKWKNGGNLMARPVEQPGMNTILDMFRNGLGKSQDRNCFGWREGDAYKWLTFDEVYAQIRTLAGALAKNTSLKRQDRIGIYSTGKPNWMIAALAATARSLAFVPLYDTLGAESCNYIINQAEMSFIFVDTSAPAKRIIANSAKTPSLRTVVIFTDPDEETVKMAQDRGVTLITLEKFTENTRDISFEEAFAEPKADDLVAIFYTSGTTGDPKGVMLSQQSIVASCTVGIAEYFINDIADETKLAIYDVGLLYVPLAHVYGFCLCSWFFYNGGAMAFFQGNIAKLPEDCQILKPTFFPLVPRLMNRMHSKVLGELKNSWLKSAMFNFAYNRKRDLLRQGYITRESIWDRLVFHKIQGLLGGRVRAMSCGSAPISAEVLEFFRTVFGTLILEGFGQTETAGSGTMATGPVGGNVGHPVPCNYIKLVDVPECGYSVKDGKGEICFKGFGVMKGYYKMPEKTAEVLDADGWLHSGDIGEFLPDGALRIIDRKKNILKLAQGEYIAPEKVEGVYLLYPEVLQIYVDGRSLESYMVAIAYPEPAMAARYAKQHGVDPNAVYSDEGYRKHILEALREVGKANKLNSLEQIKTIHLISEQFTLENGLLTPTLKNKRPELRKYFKSQIDALYKAGPLVGAESS